MSRTSTLRRVGWVASVAGVVAALVVTLAAVKTRATELLLGAGDTVFSYERALHGERVDEVRVNGLGFRVASGATTDGLAVVLDGFEARCAAANADVRSEIESLRHGRSENGRSVAQSLRFEGTLRAERGGRGAVACLGRSTREGDKSLSARLRAFLRSGDLAEIGPIRLFFASAQKTTTTYVALLSDGTLPLTRAFPETGDAPGRDLSYLPRPRGTERRLSAWAPGTTAAVFVYEARGQEPALSLSLYRTALAAAGWTVSAPPDREGYFLARSGSRAVLASVASMPVDRALMTIVSL
jgi:hypothetical protein